MAVNDRRLSLSSQRSIVVGDLLSRLLIPILLLTSAPFSRSQQDGSVRLAGGTSSEGRLEVYYNGTWGTVCKDYFDYIDAGVVCNSLGFGYRGTYIGTQYGPGTGPIWLDHVRCRGNETSIANCGHRGWKSHDCDHSEDVSVSCGTSPSIQYGPLSNTDNFFVVADKYLRNIYQVDATSGATAQLLQFGAASWPRALAYDPVAKLIYWTNDDGIINRYSFLTNNSTTIYSAPSSAVWYTGLTIDVGRQKLYYTDSGDGNVGELSTDGTGHRVLISENSKPYGGVIDVDNRMLYWTDWNTTNPGIYRSSVISPARETVINGSLQWPTALAIDFTAGVMYWGDAYLDKIETAYLNGTGRRTLLTETSADYRDFALHDGNMYFTDLQNEYIRKMNIATTLTSTISSATPFQVPFGIVFVPGTSTAATTTTIEEETSMTATSGPITTATSSTTNDSSFPLTLVIAVVGVIIIFFVIICIIAACKWRLEHRVQTTDTSELQPSTYFESEQHEDHADVLARWYNRVFMTMDAQSVASCMITCQALDVRDLEQITSRRGEPINAAQHLLDIVKSGRYAVYVCFLDALNVTGHQHVRTLLQTGNSQAFDQQFAHAASVQQNYKYLLEKMDATNSGLLNTLHAKEVIDHREQELIRSHQTSYAQNQELLFVLLRKTKDHFEKFLDALDSTGQHHVRSYIEDT